MNGTSIMVDCPNCQQEHTVELRYDDGWLDEVVEHCHCRLTTAQRQEAAHAAETGQGVAVGCEPEWEPGL